MTAKSSAKNREVNLCPVNSLGKTNETYGKVANEANIPAKIILFVLRLEFL
jgi:hypothetical protein